MGRQNSTIDPACEAIVLSDLVIREHGTGKVSLIGCFSVFNAPKYPFSTPQFFVTLFLTRLSGKAPALDVALRLEDTVGQVFCSSSAHMEPRTDRVLPQGAVIEVPIPMPRAMIPQPGLYRVVALLNGEELATKMLQFGTVTAAQGEDWPCPHQT